MNEELKPCPFCGAEPGCKEENCALCYEKFVCVISQYTDQTSYALCSYCRTRGPVAASKHAAIAAWNIRPLEDALQARVEALEAALVEIRLIARSVLPSEEVIADHQAHWNRNELYQIAKKADRALKGEVKE